MARMKDLFLWFSDKYDIYDEETEEWEFRNRLFLIDTPPDKGEGIRIVIKHYGDDPQQYILDLYKGTNYDADISPEEMFEVLTNAIDGIMVNMPKD